MPPTASIEAISQISLDAVIATTCKGVIINWSSVTEDIFGWSADEVLGRPVGEIIITPKDRQAHADAMAHFHATGELPSLGTRMTTNALHKHGHEFPVELTLTLIGDARTGNFISFIRDLSSTYAMAQKGKKLNDELVHVSWAAAAEEVSSKLSHELAQPLTAISNMATAAKLVLEADGLAQSPALPMIEQVSDSVRKASAILRSVRELSLAVKPETTRFRLRPAVDEVVNLMNAAAATVLPVSVQIEDAMTVRADRIKLQQVLLNLIRNASEAIAAAAAGKIEVTAQVHEGTVRLSVCDNGPGVSPAMLPTIFHVVESTKSGGMGIGLSICRTIAEMHGGRIWVESDKGRGARFHVELPD
jgi:two-component system sensor kinase FixL